MVSSSNGDLAVLLSSGQTGPKSNVSSSAHCSPYPSWQVTLEEYGGLGADAGSVTGGQMRRLKRA